MHCWSRSECTECLTLRKQVILQLHCILYALHIVPTTGKHSQLFSVESEK